MAKPPRRQGTPSTYPPPALEPEVMGFPVVTPTSNSQPPRPQTPPAQQPDNWSTGLYNCCSDCKICCLVCFCPCIAFGRISEIVDKGTSSCCFNGCLYLGLCLMGGLGSGFGLPLGLQCIYSCTYRGKMKHTYNIPASCCEECCVHFWCGACALCQEYRELQIRGYDVSLGWNGNMENQRPESSNATRPTVVAVAAPVAPSMNR